MTDDLKPCPFCGSTPGAHGVDGRDMISVWCTCGARGPDRGYDVWNASEILPLVYGDWNTRADLAPITPAQDDGSINIRAAFMEQIEKAADEQDWPEGYSMNDIVSDICHYLRDGPKVTLTQARNAALEEAARMASEFPAVKLRATIPCDPSEAVTETSHEIAVGIRNLKAISEGE